jgi:transaldolase
MKKVEDLKVKLFADGADKSSMLEMFSNPFIQGLTRNPTQMKKGRNYRLSTLASPT